MKVVLTLAVMGLLVVATIGLSGEGPEWTKYVGAGMVFLLLMLILQQVSNTPSTIELKKILGSDQSAAQKPSPTVPDDDDDDVRGRRSARN